MLNTVARNAEYNRAQTLLSRSPFLPHRLRSLPAHGTQGFVRKRLLPIILPGEETLARSLPIQLVPSIMEKWTEQGPSDAVVRELVGSTVVNGETEDEKLGILGAVSPGKPLLIEKDERPEITFDEYRAMSTSLVLVAFVLNNFRRCRVCGDLVTGHFLRRQVALIYSPL